MDQIDELLTRGVDKIYPSREELEKVLRDGKKLRLYQGFDPTGTKLHIGHMVGFRKLRQWQDLGHHVIFLIGDGTGQAGDPSGKTTARDKFLTQKELRANALDYVKQAGKIVRFDGENAVEILYNGDWLNKLTLPEILEIASHFTWQQFAERDLFQERIKNNQPIVFREAMYPLLQAYDSIAMDVDLELGGSDQTFNMLAGRSLMKAMKNKNKFVMTTPLLEDSEGRKIGKTEGNVIALTDDPSDLYRKIMALGDDMILKGLEYLTGVPMDETRDIENQIKSGANPIDFKKRLAYEVTKQLNSKDEAKNAESEFERVVQKGETPQNIDEREVKADQIIDEDLLVQLGLANSKSDAKRLFEQNGVSLDGQKISSGQTLGGEGEESILKVGKRVVKLKSNE